MARFQGSAGGHGDHRAGRHAHSAERRLPAAEDMMVRVGLASAAFALLVVAAAAPALAQSSLSDPINSVYQAQQNNEAAAKPTITGPAGTTYN